MIKLKLIVLHIMFNYIKLCDAIVYFSLLFQVTNSSEFGVHGYDNEDMDMHPFFMARGPKIKKYHQVAPFDTVDLLSLFGEILEIAVPPNNGTVEHIRDILSDNATLVPLLVIIGKNC